VQRPSAERLCWESVPSRAGKNYPNTQEICRTPNILSKYFTSFCALLVNNSCWILVKGWSCEEDLRVRDTAEENRQGARLVILLARSIWYCCGIFCFLCSFWNVLHASFVCTNAGVWHFGRMLLEAWPLNYRAGDACCWREHAFGSESWSNQVVGEPTTGCGFLVIFSSGFTELVCTVYASFCKRTWHTEGRTYEHGVRCRH
jgi:hypothetical protein